ncbi:MAG TPA: DEAD/DEAH box helicase [Microthrixaceae bacterium]|nr:DEAD/DEAH box helicase [Microthrixaceae bacterium]
MEPLDIHPGMAGDDVLDRFTKWVSEHGLTMYPAQEDATLALFADDHVVITTPTGSGKSLVATAGHAEAFAAGAVSVYTAPIKALVSEKFFDFREIFGDENVGMVTGDTQINPTAPILCCTAEILAHAVLESGRDLPIRHVTMDEFHYFAERDRGWAWELPLLELPDTRFLLMSATLGDTTWLDEHLEAETSRTTTVVSGGERPVPLSFRYAVTPLHETVNELVSDGLAPVYVVYFTQKAASQAAQSFMSLNVLTKDEKRRAAELMAGFRFETPFGKDLRRYLAAGIRGPPRWSAPPLSTARRTVGS